MEVVGFTKMADGSREEYEFLDKMEHEFVDGLPERIFAHLRSLDQSISGYRVTRLTHSLQSATRAHRAGEAEEMVVVAICLPRCRTARWRQPYYARLSQKKPTGLSSITGCSRRFITHTIAVEIVMSVTG